MCPGPSSILNIYLFSTNRIVFRLEFFTFAHKHKKHAHMLVVRASRPTDVHSISCERPHRISCWEFVAAQATHNKSNGRKMFEKRLKCWRGGASYDSGEICAHTRRVYDRRRNGFYFPVPLTRHTQQSAAQQSTATHRFATVCVECRELRYSRVIY